MVAAYLLVALQTLVSREVAPATLAVVTVGSLMGGTTFNVIPDEAVLQGTVRAFDPQTRDLLEQRIGELAHSIAGGMRAAADVAYQRGYPPLVNDVAMATLACGAPSAICLGTPRSSPTTNRSWPPKTSPSSWSASRARCAVSGSGVPAWESPRNAHSSRFAIDEDALPIGVAALPAWPCATSTRAHRDATDATAGHRGGPRPGGCACDASETASSPSPGRTIRPQPGANCRRYQE